MYSYKWVCDSSMLYVSHFSTCILSEVVVIPNCVQIIHNKASSVATSMENRIHLLGGFRCFGFLLLARWSNLTNIFFPKWVGSTTNSKNHQLENQLVFLEPKHFAIFVATPTSVSSPNQIDQTCMCLYLNSLFDITYAPCMEYLPTFTIHVSFAKQFYSSRCSGFKEFWFSPRPLGKWCNLTNIFQMG